MNRGHNVHEGEEYEAYPVLLLQCMRVITYPLEYPNGEKILVCRTCICLPENAERRLFAVVMALQKYEH
jgi:hypothetical protein